MIADPFHNLADSPTSPAELCFTVTASDSASLPRATKALYVGTGGDLTVRSIGADEPVTFRNLADGQTIDIRAAQVFATGTTAAVIVGLA